MALPMDSLTLTPKDAGASDMGSSLGSSMPGFAPLAIGFLGLLFLLASTVVTWLYEGRSRGAQA